MVTSLTARQTQILKALIDEYIETAGPVGSLALEKKYNLGVSPATIRNEMVNLTKSGFLKQPHTSAGRVPSPKAMKFYVNQLMEEKQMSLTDEVKTKEEVWDARGSLNELVKEATHLLAQQTKSLAVGMINEDRKLWHSGYANLFSTPEFTDLVFCSDLFSLIEEFEKIQEIFFGHLSGAGPVEVLFGEDLDWPGLSSLGVAATRFSAQGKTVGLGVMGPMRLHYSSIFPVLKHLNQLITEIAEKR